MPNQENYQPGLKSGNVILGANLGTGIGHFQKTVNMTTDTALPEKTLFGTSGMGIASTITGFFVAGLDGTAVSVSLTAGQASVATCALLGEEATASVMIGPNAALVATQVAANVNIFLENSASADVLATVTFEIG